MGSQTEFIYPSLKRYKTWFVLSGLFLFSSLIFDIVTSQTYNLTQRAGAVLTMAAVLSEFAINRFMIKFSQDCQINFVMEYEIAKGTPVDKNSDEYKLYINAIEMNEHASRLHNERTIYTALETSWVVVGTLIWSYGDLLPITYVSNLLKF